MRQCSEAEFLRDVAKHKMVVAMDNGVYRHLVFGEPGTFNHWFGIITWPDFLTVFGDMGTWTFSRVEDMFRFFRGKPGGELKINPSYWSEKLRNGVHGGCRDARIFDVAAFQNQLIERLGGYGDDEFSDAERKEIEAAIRSEIYEDNQALAMKAAYDFYVTLESGKKFSMDTDDMPSGEVYGFHFLWCLYAIVWGIRQYDLLEKEKQPC